MHNSHKEQSSFSLQGDTPHRQSIPKPMRVLTSRMKYIIPLLLIFSAMVCMGLVSAAENIADGKEKNVGVWILQEQKGPIYSSPAENQSLFQMNFVVDPSSSSSALDIILTPEQYGLETLAETDIASWQWSLSDRTTMIPFSAGFDPGEYTIQLIICTSEGVCETIEASRYISIEGLLCPFDPNQQVPSYPTPIQVPIPTKSPKIKFSTSTAGALFQTGPAYVQPNTVVQLQVADLEYDIAQIQWDYGDGTSSGWMPASTSQKTSHTYRTPGVYRPVVTVRNVGIGFQLSSEESDEHRVIVQESQSNVPPPQQAPTQMGIVYIVTYPKGVNIFVDGEYGGTSDVMITRLPAGTYDITLKRDGFMDWQGQVDAVAGKITMQVYHYDRYPAVTTDVFNPPKF